MRKKFEDVARLAELHYELTKNTKNPQTIGRHLQKLSEEFGELAQSVNKITGLKSIKKNESLKSINLNIREEGADMIQIIFAILHLAGHKYDDLKEHLGIKNNAYANGLEKQKKKLAKKTGKKIKK